MTVSRRLFITSLSTAFVAAPFARQAWAAAQMDADRFIDLSARLTGREASSLDRSGAEKMLATFVARGDDGALQALADAPRPDTPLAREIVGSWYSGLVEGKEETVVATFSGALLFSTVHFLHPFGNCGGLTNSWAEIPEE